MGKSFGLSGDEIFLCSRSTEQCDIDNIHYRKCDLTKLVDIKKILNEVGKVDAILFSADTASVFGNFENFDYKDISSFLETKILGSILFIQELIKRQIKIKVIFFCGKTGHKDRNYFLYSIVNASILAFVEELNILFPFIRGFYLEVPLIVPSTIGSMYIDTFDKNASSFKPEILIPKIKNILEDKEKVGLVRVSNNAL